MFDDSDLAAIREICNHIHDVQRLGLEQIPGHVKRSGVFADCSMACVDAGCLAIKAQRVLEKMQHPAPTTR